MGRSGKGVGSNLNGDSPSPTRSVDGVETPYPPTTIKEKLDRKNELKARGTLLMALLNKHQLKFNSYKTAKSLMEATEKRFGSNKDSKKVLKTLLKQQYENFNETSSEGLDQIYDRLQKLINSYPDLENKPDLETLSMDNLYNNLKIYEAEVMSNTAHGVSATSSKTNASNLPNVVSLKEMNLKWQMEMLTLRAKRFLQKTGRNLGVKEIKTIGFHKTKVECYNCHRRGHFARECRAPKHQDNRNCEAPRRTVPVKDTTSNSLMNDKYNTCEGYHAVPPPYTGNFMPPKPDLVFADEHVVNESVTSLPGIANIKVKPSETKLKNVSAPIIEDWVFNSED
nr:ribonuclease H-like domain-containing protein [Tanacetum cinerariifolium]